MYIWAQNSMDNKKGYILSEGLSASNGHLSHERGYEANFPVLTVMGCFWFVGQREVQIFNSESVKSVVKLHSFRLAILTVQKVIGYFLYDFFLYAGSL